MPRTAVAAALAASFFGTRRSAWAEPITSARLEWTTLPPAECIDATTVERTVEARLGRAIFVRSRADLPIAGNSLLIVAGYEHVPGRDAVKLRILSPTGQKLGERELSSSTGCAELQASLPVVIAVLIDLESSTRASGEPADAAAAPSSAAPTVQVPAAPTAAVTPENAVATPPPVAEAPTPAGRAARADRSAPAITVAALVGALLGQQPGVAPEGGLEAAFGLGGPWEIGAWTDARTPTSTSGPHAFTLFSAALGAGFCAEWALEPTLIRAGGCAGGGVAFLHAVAASFPAPSANSRFEAEARLVAHADYRLGPVLFARADGGVVVPFSRPNYGFINDHGDSAHLYQSGKVAGFGRLGVGLQWR